MKETPEKKAEKKRQINFQRNHIKIQDAYNELLKAGGSPTYKEIAKACGLNLNTVYNHFQELKLDDMIKIHQANLNEILQKLSSEAKSGDTKAMNLYLKVIAKWVPTTALNIDIGDKKLPIQFVDNDDSGPAE